jgi:hypothetical protein
MTRRAKRRVRPRDRVPSASHAVPRDAKVVDAELDEALDESFPASDPIAVDATVQSAKPRGSRNR